MNNILDLFDQTFFVEFTDGTGVVRGSSSVAVTTQ